MSISKLLTTETNLNAPGDCLVCPEPLLTSLLKPFSVLSNFCIICLKSSCAYLHLQKASQQTLILLVKQILSLSQLQSVQSRCHSLTRKSNVLPDTQITHSSHLHKIHSRLFKIIEDRSPVEAYFKSNNERRIHGSHAFKFVVPSEQRKIFLSFLSSQKQ